MINYRAIVSRDFWHNFLINNFLRAPEYIIYIRVVTSHRFFEISRKYSQFNKHHLCQWHFSGKWWKCFNIVFSFYRRDCWHLWQINRWRCLLERCDCRCEQHRRKFAASKLKCSIKNLLLSKKKVRKSNMMGNMIEAKNTEF